MKKPMVICVILFCILLLVGCSSVKVEETGTSKEESTPILPEMTFSAATLTVTEENIQALVTGGRGNGAIFDYNTNKDIGAIEVNVIENKEGSMPVVINSNRSSLDFKNGRCYFEYSMDKSELNVAFQGENNGNTGTATFTSTFDVEEETEGYSTRTQMYLNSNTKIKVGEEIPITLVIESDFDEMTTWPIEKYIEEPNLLKEYEKSYLITVTFLEEDA